MPGRFENKVVAVTGAAGGIGSALCKQFAREGASVALLDNRADALQSAHDAVLAEGMRALSVTVDVTNALNCETAVEQVCAEFGGIDVLIHSAGLTHFSLAEHTNPQVYRRVMDVNFFGAVHCTHAALPSLIERRGAIGVLSSVAGFAPLLGRTGYCASKHALHGYFETLRCEVKRHGVSVTMICPSFTKSDLEKRALGADGNPVTTGRSSLGATASPEVLAAAIVQAIARRKRLVLPSGLSRTSRVLRVIAPRLYDQMMTHRFKSEFDRDSRQ